MTPDETVHSLRQAVSIVNALLTAGAPLVAARPSINVMSDAAWMVLLLPDDTLLTPGDSELGMAVANAGRTIQVPDSVDELLGFADSPTDLTAERAGRLEGGLSRLAMSHQLPTDVADAVDVVIDYLQRSKQ